MTAEEATARAAEEASALGFPWNSGNVVTSRRRLWPLTGVWFVTSTVLTPRAVTTMRVLERTGETFPVSVRYPAAARSAHAVDPGRLLAFLALALLGGLAAGAIARRVLEWPWWIALPIALAWAVLLPFVLTRLSRPPSG